MVIDRELENSVVIKSMLVVESLTAEPEDIKWYRAIQEHVAVKKS